MPERLLLAMLATFLAGCTTAAVPRSPAVRPIPTVAATSVLQATPAATAAPTSTPTAVPTPEPSADPSVLDLEATSCEGGVVLGWTPSRHPDFHHYIALRSPVADIAPAYPPIAPAVDWGDTYATDPFVTSAVDASVVPSATRWHYRVMAYDADGRVLAASPVRSARLDEVDGLGAVEAWPIGGDRTRLRWTAYGGFSQCFSSYRVLYGTGGQPQTVLTVISDQARIELETDALHAGTTYAIRVEAVRTTTLGSFTVARTDVLTYSVPPAD